MAYIGKQPIVGNFQICDAISVVNGQAAYTMQVASTNVSPESASHMLVSLNGVLQKPGSSFTVSGATITFASNLATGDVIDFIILLGDALNLGTPSDGTVATAKIAANAVTGAKLNTDVISAQTALGAEPADTDEFLVSDAGVLKRVDYSYIKGGGGLIHIKTQTADDTSQIDFINGTSDVVFDGTYNKYCFMIDIHPVTDNVTPQMLYRQATNSTFLTSDYAYAGQGIDAANAEVTRKNTSDSQIEIANSTVGAASDETMAITLFISMPSRTDTHCLSYWNGVMLNTSGNLQSFEMTGTNTGTVNAIDGIRFKYSSGNISYGTISMFGVANS